MSTGQAMRHVEVKIRFEVIRRLAAPLVNRCVAKGAQLSRRLRRPSRMVSVLQAQSIQRRREIRGITEARRLGRAAGRVYRARNRDDILEAISYQVLLAAQCNRRFAYQYREE